MSVWTLLYQGVEQDFAGWGLGKLTRNRASMTTDKCGFVATVKNIATVAPFSEYQSATIKRNGLPWFTGVFTGIQRKGSGRSKTINYELSGPWWYLEQTIFQQMWATWSVAGEALTLISTLQSLVIVGQTPEGVKEDLGQVMTDVLNFVIAACLNGLTLPDGTNTGPIVPFTLGLMTPDTIIPYSQVQDKKCSELLQYCMRWIADGVGWVDYSTVPPVLNFAERPTLPTKTISVRNGLVTSQFNPKPRYDLQVPAVVIKYRQVNTIDGVTYTIQAVDKYPLAAPDPALRNLVMDIDLVGGHATYQHQDVTVRDRLVSPGDEIAVSWLAKHNSEIAAMDIDNMTVTAVNTVVDPDDPALALPGFNADTLTEELVSGAVTTWMKTSDNVVAATANITAMVVYTGTDPATLAYFASHPGGVLVSVRCVITNAQTQTYKELTSLLPSEPIPVGLAQALWQALNPLHFEGELETTESVCSDPLPIGTIFNTTDGLPEWQAMNAQVLEVSEDVFNGKTKIKFGPPLMLTVQDWVDLLRANRGTVYAYTLNQRTTGKPGDSNPVIGHTNSPASSSSLPSAKVQPNPYTCTDASVGATPMIAVTPGKHQGGIATGSPVTVAAGSGVLYRKVDFTYDSLNNVTVSDNVPTTAGGSNVVTPAGGGGGGSGTLYDAICEYTATVVSGKASVSTNPLVGGSQGFGVCGGAISGPWGA